MGGVLTARRNRRGDGAATWECPDCGGDFNLHQPATERPDRLLAVCDDCGEWFLTRGRRHPVSRLVPVETWDK